MVRASALPLLALIVATLVSAQEDTSHAALIAMSRQANEPRESEYYGLDLYPESKLARYRMQTQDGDQNELAFMAPDDEYMPQGDLNYGNNKLSRVMMEQVYPSEYAGKTRNKTLKKVLLDFLEDNDIDPQQEAMKKRSMSPFRERMEEEKFKNQRDDLAEMFLRKFENEEEERDDADREYDANKEYIETLKDLWSKYKNSRPSTYSVQDYEPRFFMSEVKRKRQMTEYPSLGWAGVGYRKRESPTDNEFTSEELPRFGNDEDERSPVHRYEWMPDSKARGIYSPEYLYTIRKRNAVTKRSSNFYPSNSSAHRKRFANKEQYRKKFVKKEHATGTDPKIMKDLKNIFGDKDNDKNDTSFEKKSLKMEEKKKRDENIEKKKKDDNNEKKKSVETASKESVDVATTTEHHHEHSAEKKKRAQEEEVANQVNEDERVSIKKKSVDWSNYFGYDRRKKSRQNFNGNIDDDWLMDRYHNAIASAKKKSTEYPLKFFRNHDEVKKAAYESDNDDYQRDKKGEVANTNESKLGEMDVKLKNIEDLIIDEALKYTGAHEGTTDSKEIQEVKDKVISRLAAAYSLEKMRRALSEFKTSIATQRYALNNDNEYKDDDETSEEEKKTDNTDEKRAPEEKCEKKKKKSDRSENEINSDETQESESANSISGAADLGILERRCRSVAAGEPNDFFYPLCKAHQFCYLCSPDDNQEALTNCDVMFLSKAYVLCQGDLACQWAARPAIEYLRDAFESMEVPQIFDRTLCQAGMPYDNEPNHLLGYKIRRR